MEFSDLLENLDNLTRVYRGLISVNPGYLTGIELNKIFTRL